MAFTNAVPLAISFAKGIGIMILFSHGLILYFTAFYSNDIPVSVKSLWSHARMCSREGSAYARCGNVR